MKNLIRDFIGYRKLEPQGKMVDPFIVEGVLVLICQEGGFAYDAFRLDGVYLDDSLAEHFGVNRVMPMGDRPVGRVRITVEKLSDHACTEA